MQYRLMKDEEENKRELLAETKQLKLNTQNCEFARDKMSIVLEEYETCVETTVVRSLPSPA